MGTGIRNYMKLDCWRPFRSRFVYVDTKEYLADRRFIYNGVKVKFTKGEFHKEGTEYIIVICEVASKDEQRFVDSMEQLKANMILLGHEDYESACKDFFGAIQQVPA